MKVKTRNRKRESSHQVHQTLHRRINLIVAKVWRLNRLWLLINRMPIIKR